jgi:hypothetical protein
MKAFPHEEWLDSIDPQVLNPIRHPGMDLRDYFAAQAMQGFLTQKYTDAPSVKIAEWAYEMADAMMEYRK